MGSVGNIMQGFAGAGVVGAVTAAIGETAKALDWAIGEASQAEQAIKNLSAAVERSGTSWDSVSKQTQDYMSQLQKTTVYSDEAIAGMIERLLTFGMTYDEAMKAAGTAVDLAAAKHIDLESAANIVGKAFMGNTAILQRYGIDVQTSKDATAALKDAVAILSDGIKTSGDSLQGFSSTLEAAGVSLTTTEGQMRGAKDIAEELIGAFQSGKLDAEAFSQIMGELGVSIDMSKLAAADFPAVMSALNEQFGGAAQEQAKTYAGIQERLKNATSDLGEKIGGIVLPALAGMTEAMIPVVDALGKGVDAVGAWLTEVGKMPEVQAVADALGGAFQGLMKWFDDLGKAAVEILGPALQELWAAFKDIWDALAPIGEALGEIWSIFSEGEGSGNLLKDVLGLVALNIKAVALIIKEVAPYIKQFAEAFKAAADFIAPILTELKDAVGAFISWLKDTFQGFYNWLVGGSLWSDLWQKVQSIATSAGDVIAGIIRGMFTVLNTIFQGGVNLLASILTAGFQAGFLAVQGIVTSATDILRGLIRSIQDLIGGVTRDWSELTSVISSSIGPMRAAISDFWNWLLPYWRANVNQLVTATQAGFGQIQQAVTQATWGTVAPTQTAMSAVTNTFTGAFDTITGAATEFWNWLVGGSLWPEGLADMRKQTIKGMTRVTASLAKSLAKIEDRFADISLSFILAAPNLSIFRDFDSVLRQAAASVDRHLGNAADTLAGYMSDMTDEIAGFYEWFVGGSVWSDLWTQAFALISNHGGEIQAFVQTMMTNIVNYFTAGLSTVAQLWSKFWTDAATFTSSSGVTILEMIQGFTAKLTDSFKSLSDSIGPAWTQLWTTLKADFDAFTSTLPSGLTELWQGLQATFSGNMQSLYVNWQKAWQLMTDAPKEALDQTAAAFKSFFNTIAGYFGTMGAISYTMEKTTTAGGDEVLRVLDMWISNSEGAFGALIHAWITFLKTFYLTAWQWLVSTGLRFESFFNHMVIPAVTGLGDQINTLWQERLTTFWNIAVTETQHSADRFQMMADRILNEIMTPFGEALTAAWTTLTDALKAAWDLCWQTVETKFTTTTQTILANVTAWWKQVSDLFTVQLTALQGAWSTAWSVMEGLLTASLGRMQSNANSILGSIVVRVQEVMAQIQAAAAQLMTQLVGGSIWPEMLDLMEQITQAALTVLRDLFERTFEAIRASGSTSMQGLAASISGAFNSMIGSAQAAVANAKALQAQAAAIGARAQATITGPVRVSAEEVRRQAAGWAKETEYATWMLQKAASQAGGLTAAQMEEYGTRLAALGFERMFGRSTAGGPATMEEVRHAIQMGTAPASMWPAVYGSLQTLPGDFLRIAKSGLAVVHEGEVVGRPSDVNLQNVVNVEVDGATVARTVERRMITQRQMSGG